MTVDQIGSRRVGDRVDDLLETLAQHLAREPGRRPVRAFERTVGDEVQAVLDDAVLVVELSAAILRTGGWSVGIGAGPVVEPLPASSRAGSGDAFVLARAAVERAKTRPGGVAVAVVGSDPVPAADAEAVLTLLGAVASRRTAAGWQVIDAVRDAGAGARQGEVARRLGVTQQAVSQRLRTALWAEELAARPLAARLLRAAEGTRVLGA
ncbi:MarR family transcriptional regulator [Cellulomonas aerilata]|uniref:Uncharacterized protein n=1 Tax=Cellulomonas aerilata TaxID=515326 RepID=A0A512DAA3_9CELL|nr:MarR family transcriptional regulator [Cellulomonas aerilata]GEO33414.1 hypothetical protein CAE01nite_11390 [Cellulomonas aerilata]